MKKIIRPQSGQDDKKNLLALAKKRPHDFWQYEKELQLSLESLQSGSNLSKILYHFF